MWENATSVVEGFCQFAPLAAIILGSQAVARHAQDRKARREAVRIRAMLRLSLRALLDLYEDNRRLLAGEDRRLASGRQQIQLLRIHIGRLAVLEDETQIAAVLAASFAMESAETAMAVAGKPVSGVAFLLPAEDAAAEAAMPLLQQACAALQTAEAMLAQAAAGPSVATVAAGVARLHAASGRLSAALHRGRRAHRAAWVEARR
jgi:hypothetical protein